MKSCKALWVFVFLLAFFTPTQAQDSRVDIFGNNGFLARAFSWSDPGAASTSGKSFIFRPTSPNMIITITIRNNDSTTHSFNFAVSQTAAADANDFSNNQSQWVASSSVGIGFCPSSASMITKAILSCNISVIGAAQMVATLSSAAGATGTNNTFDIIINQTNNFTLSAIGTSAQQIQGASAAGSSALENPVLIGGVDGSGNQGPKHAICVTAVPATGYDPIIGGTCGFLATGSYFISWSPTQLGMNSVVLPASGTVTSNVIDLRGVRQGTLFVGCDQIVNALISLKAEDGSTQLNVTTLLGAVPAVGTSAGVNVAMAATLFPLRAASFIMSNTTATPGTCTVRLFLAY